MLRAAHFIKGPGSSMVFTWALSGFLYPCLGVFVCTTMVLEPFGLGTGSGVRRFAQLTPQA